MITTTKIKISSSSGIAAGRPKSKTVIGHKTIAAKIETSHSNSDAGGNKKD